MPSDKTYGFNVTRLGHAVRRLRLDQGMTQNYLAEFSGVSKFEVGAIERGVVRKPGPEVLEAIAAGLGVQTEALVSLMHEDEGPAGCSVVTICPKKGEMAALRCERYRMEHARFCEGCDWESANMAGTAAPTSTLRSSGHALDYGHGGEVRLL